MTGARQGDLFTTLAPARGTTDRPLNVYTIPPGVPFVDALAAGLLDRYPGEALPRVRVLLPTRRAVRSLHEAFLRRSGGQSLLLPTMRPIGDVDEDDLLLDSLGPDNEVAELPPAIPGLQRQFLLADLILKWGERRDGQRASAAQAADLAAELARLIDQVQTERVSFAALCTLVPADYAAHWQKTIEFLRIVTEHWPAILAEIGALDPGDRRNRLLETLARRWSAQPPSGPVVAAGSTGSIPATQDLLAVVARLPNGSIVLPGLDAGLDADSWEAIDQTHPQFNLKRLIERLGVDRRQVAVWPVPGFDLEPNSRVALLSEALRPAATTHEWVNAVAPPRAAAGLTRVVCPGPRDEAAVIALVLRQTLEGPGRTAALVTPDRRLARRVAAELGRWDIAIDDSAGIPLANTPPGVFFRLIVRMVASDLAPVDLLAALKHPLAGGGRSPVVFRTLVRRLETSILRGPRPQPGFKGLHQALGPAPRYDDLRTWLRDLERIVGRFGDRLRGHVPFADLLRAHAEMAEALAASDAEAGADRLWSDEAGEALSTFVSECADAAGYFPAVSSADYADLLDHLLAARSVRPAFGRHPRLAIWGPLEARLQSADVLVLGGLNDGTWPPHATVDPWLSRPMRAALGLPAPERRIGLAAHDFIQAAAAPNVVLTRAAKVDGTPTVPSRWWLRLQTLLGEPDGKEAAQATTLLSWAAALDQPRGRPRPVAPPAFAPPAHVRPRQLSVSDVETLVRNPYGFYARRILNLRPLDPIDAELQAADRGSLVHGVLASFVRAHPDRLPDEALAELLAIGRRAFGEWLGRPAVLAFWWSWFERAADWFVATDAERRQRVLSVSAEVKGRWDLVTPAGAFVLVAQADRIERQATGGIAIVDYKTGTLPTRIDVDLGLNPQLPLEGVMAAAGAFESVAADAIVELAYWKLGGEQGGRAFALHNPATLVATAETGLALLLAKFADPTTPYRAVPRPAAAPRFDDYGHLARVKEWTALEVSDL
ncbi:MAG: double-strand break repair protein AddB [Alphaproteobacteria bacterium]|nr:double-strand break repair protein AddB [Alphaproteobacteria bacterium]